MAERDISAEVYHRVQQLEQSFGTDWPIAIETIGFYGYPNVPPEFKITIVEVKNPNVILIDESFEFISMDMLEIKLKDMSYYIYEQYATPIEQVLPFQDVKFTSIQDESDRFVDEKCS